MNNTQTGYASIDRPWRNYYDENLPKELRLPKKSIYQLAKHANLNNLNNVAIDMRSSMNDFKKGIKITYKDFFARIERNAKSFKVLGVKPNEIMPIILPNVPEARTLIYANSVIGSASYPISPLLPNNSLEQIIKENGIKNVVIFSAFYDKYKGVLENCNLNSVIYLDGTESLPTPLRMINKLKEKMSKTNKVPTRENVLTWDEYQKLGRRVKEIEPYYEEDHVAAIIGTSGTTGVPKGVCLTDDNVNAAAINYVDSKNFEGTFLDALLPSIGYGISMLHYQTVGGHYTYLIPELVTTKIADLIQTVKPDNFPGGPVHYINLEKSEAFKNGTLYKGPNFISGGASLPAEVEKTLNKIDEGYEEDGINDDLVVRQGFGLTENVATGSYSKRGSYRFGSIGIPLPYATVSIFKPGTDEELTYGEKGEICITGDTVMKGYLNNPEETDKVILTHKDGRRWIHTKDIGYMDEKGRIFHMERIKNIFMRTGFNVHPSKISEFLNTLPEVDNSYVMGFDHPEEQAVPVAFVVKSSDTKKTDEEIIDTMSKACFANLEEPSVPYEYVFVDELPVNVGGKIDGQRLKAESGIDYCTKAKVLRK